MLGRIIAQARKASVETELNDNLKATLSQQPAFPLAARKPLLLKTKSWLLLLLVSLQGSQLPMYLA